MTPDIEYIESLREQAKDFTMVAFYDNMLLRMRYSHIKMLDVFMSTMQRGQWVSIEEYHP